MTDFIPPKSYQEACAMMGQTFVCPDGVERAVYGAGMSGDKYSVTFKDNSRWTVDNGFETERDVKLRQWTASWTGLKADERELVLAIFPDLLERDQATLKHGHKLVDAAKATLIKRGKIAPVTCGRCGGCGQYSYNQIDGTVCYGCGGSGKKYPATRDALAAARRITCD